MKYPDILLLKIIHDFLYAKDLYEEKHQFLSNKHEWAGLKHFKDSKAFIEYSHDMDDAYENIEEHNWNKNCKILIVFYDVIADMIINKNFNPIVTELFLREKKLNISFVFKSLNKSHIVIHQILTLKTLWIFPEHML